MTAVADGPAAAIRAQLEYDTGSFTRAQTRGARSQESLGRLSNQRIVYPFQLPATYAWVGDPWGG